MKHGRNPEVMPSMVLGLLITGVGVILLLDRFGMVEIDRIWRFWPVALIGLGLSKVIESPGSLGRIWGGFFVAGGALLLARNLGYMDFGIGDLWPVFVIALGLSMLTRAMTKQRSEVAEVDRRDVLREWAVFGGGDRRSNSQNFKGGEVFAVFGGFEIDLRKAQIAGNEAVVDVNFLFGGATIRVPTEWTVVMDAVGIFGGVEDKTEHPDPGPGKPEKRIVFKGFAVFGGMEVRN